MESRMPATKDINPSYNLRTLASRFDEFSLKHWYVYFLGYLSLYFINQFFVTRTIVNINGPGPIYLDPSFEGIGKDFANGNWMILLMLTAIPINAVLFNRWRDKIGTTFWHIYEWNMLSLPSYRSNELPAAFQGFMSRFERSLQSPKRFIAIGAIMLVPLSIVGYWLSQGTAYNGGTGDAWNKLHPGPLNLGPLGSIINSLAILQRDPGNVIYVSFLAYFFGVGLWVVITTIHYMRQLTREFELRIDPLHPDKCGGLGFLGTFLLEMNLPFLGLAVVIGMLGLALSGANNLFWVNVAVVALVGIIFPLTLYAFFVPLWTLHRIMTSQRNEYEHRYRPRLLKLHWTLKTAYNAGDLDVAQRAKTEMDIIGTLYSSEHFPTWPVSVPIVLSVVASQVFSLIAAVAQHYSDELSLWFRHVLAQLSGS